MISFGRYIQVHRPLLQLQYQSCRIYNPFSFLRRSGALVCRVRNQKRRPPFFVQFGTHCFSCNHEQLLSASPQERTQQLASHTHLAWSCWDTGRWRALLVLVRISVVSTILVRRWSLCRILQTTRIHLMARASSPQSCLPTSLTAKWVRRPSTSTMHVCIHTYIYTRWVLSWPERE